MNEALVLERLREHRRGSDGTKVVRGQLSQIRARRIGGR